MQLLKIYLTFDLEEFDIVQEYGHKIDWNEQIEVSKSGMQQLLGLLEKHQVTATIFTTAAFAKACPALVKQLSHHHEIASHSYWHSSFEKSDLSKSLTTLEAITGKQVFGLRMPRMRQVETEWVKQAGFTYDSSINPAYLPGRYDFRHLPRTAFLQHGLLRIPASVATYWRLPLFWLTFKNIPYVVYRLLAKTALKKDGYLNLYFHPWEFSNLNRYPLPKHVKKHSGQYLLQRLDTLITDLKKVAVFDQLKNFEIEKSPGAGDLTVLN